MAEQYLGNVAEVESLDNVSNLIIESTNNGIKKIPTEILKEGIYKDLPIDSALSETSENAVKNKVVCKKLKEIDQYKANSIITTSSGTVFHETDCAAVPPVNIELFGKGKQKTYSGKNMFNYIKGTHDTSSCTTVEVLDNGVIMQGNSNGVKPGQSVASSGWVILNRKDTDGYIYLEKDMVVTLSFDYTVLENPVETTYDIAGLLSAPNVSDLQVYNVAGIPDVNVKTRISFSFTIKQSEYYVPVISLNSCLVKIENVQIALDTDTEYEPYVGAQPSPNIHYPQKVERHGEGGSINGKVLTGNLFDIEKFFTGLSNWSIQDGCYYIPVENLYYATTTGNAKYKIPFKEKTSYTVCMKVRNESLNVDTTNIVIVYTDGTKGYSSRLNSNIFTELTVTSDASKTIEFVGFGWGAGADNLLIESITLAEGTEVTKEPYTEQPFTALTPNGLGGVPLGQTIPDSIKNSPIHMSGVYWDEVEGQYYIGDYKNYQSKQNVQVIGEDVLTGDESWKITSSITTANYNTFRRDDNIGIPIMNCNGLVNEPTLSTHFIKKTQLLDDCGGVVACVSGNRLFYFCVPKTDFPDADTFKAHVKQLYDNGTPVKNYYILAEPIITDLTEEDIAQYDSLRMNYPNTTIVNDAGAFMKVAHVKDSKCYLEKITNQYDTRIQQLENAILSLGGNI